MPAILVLLERAEICAGRGQMRVACKLLAEAEHRYESASVPQDTRIEQRFDTLCRVLGLE